MVYVDQMTPCLPNSKWRYGESCHLVGDDERELRLFAMRIGLKPNWLQRSREGMPHYDLTRSYRDRAVQAGAVEIDKYKFVELIKKHREAHRV